MKYLKTTFLLLIIFNLSGCNWGEWHVGELYSQRIEGTSKILYKYDAWGGRDSHASGFIILDSTETFEVNLEKDLKFTYLTEIPNKNNITGVTHECDNSCDKHYDKTKAKYYPIKKENDTVKNINIQILIYQYKGFNEKYRELQSYHFERFKETRDSLYFYNLNDIESVDGGHLDTLKIKKSEVVIQLNQKSYVTKIVIEDIIINKNSKEITGAHPYFLTPVNKIKSDAFSDYGIFKQVISKNNIPK